MGAFFCLHSWKQNPVSTSSVSCRCTSVHVKDGKSVQSRHNRYVRLVPFGQIQKTLSKRSVCQALSLSVCLERCRDNTSTTLLAAVCTCAHMRVLHQKISTSVYKGFMCQLACWSSLFTHLGLVACLQGAMPAPVSGPCCAHDHDCEASDCGSAWSLHKHVDLARVSTHSALGIGRSCVCAYLHGSPTKESAALTTHQVRCLNEAVDGSAKAVFKTWDKRLDFGPRPLRSNDEDPELLIHIPFNGSVTIRAICIIGAFV